MPGKHGVILPTDEEDAALTAAAEADPDNPPWPDEMLERGRLGRLARQAREATGLSQEQFAARYGLPTGTVRDWEQGRRAPDAAAVAYLRVIRKMPDAVAKALNAA